VRLVLDTNIVVSGLIWGGVPRQLLNLGQDSQMTLFTSSLLLDELADVLGRSKFAALLASQSITPTFLMQRYGLLANLVKPQAIERTVPDDADDDAVIKKLRIKGSSLELRKIKGSSLDLTYYTRQLPYHRHASNYPTALSSGIS